MNEALKNFIENVTVDELETKEAVEKEAQNNEAERKYALARGALKGILPEQILEDDVALGLAILSAMPSDSRAELASLSTTVVEPAMIEEAIKREPFGDIALLSINQDKSSIWYLALLCSVLTISNPTMGKDNILWQAFIATMAAGKGHGSEDIINSLFEVMDDTTFGLLLIKVATYMEGE